MKEITRKRGERGVDRKERLKKMTDERKASYYEKIVYYRCRLCNQRWNIFKHEALVLGHILSEHILKLDEEDKISILRKYYNRTYLTEKECLEYGIDFNRFKKFRR